MMTRRVSLPLLSAGALACAGAGAALVFACVETQPDPRPPVLVDTAQHVVLPPLALAVERAELLEGAAEALCAAPTADTLDAAQAAWWQLRGPWRQFRALPMGPLVEGSYDSAIDFWPARPSSIEGGVDGGASTVEAVAALGVASKGLPAVEYLLWQPEGGDAAVLATFTAQAPSGAQRCATLVALSGDLRAQLDALSLETQAFADELATAGDNPRYPTVSLAVDALLNAAIAGLHDLGERSLGKPLGLSTAEPQLDQLESRFSNRSRADILDALQGFARFYLGDGGDSSDGGDSDASQGFTVIVAASSESVDATVREQLELALAAAEALPDPLSTGLDTDPAAVEAAWVAIRELRLTLTADVAGLLGVTVALTDNDGD